MGVVGGGGGTHPSGQYAYAVFIWSSQSDNRYDRGNLALYEKWKPPETTTCKPDLTQAFLQVPQQAISLIKPLLHFEAFR